MGGSRTHRGGGNPSGSFGSPRRTGSPFGGFGGRRAYDRPVAPPPRPHYGGYGGFRRGFGYGGGYTGGGYAGGAGGCGGCLATLVMLVVILALVALIGSMSCSAPRVTQSGTTSSSQIAQVTHTHKKLPASACETSDEWIDDRAQWIDNESQVISALRYFYDKTGSQPYLVIATDVDGETDFTDAEGEDWANDIYDEQFDDDGHTVVAFVEYADSEYAYYIVAGREAQSVIDQEAREIIADEINYWYTDSSLDDSAYFAKVFRESADTIMFDYEETTKTANSHRRTLVIAVGAVAVAAVIGFVVINASRRKKEEYGAAERLAGTPVTGMGTGSIPTETEHTSTASTADASDSVDSATAELEEFEQKYGID